MVCKTSDFTPQCGALIEKLFLDAGFPKDLVTVVQGGGEVGQALIDAAPDKVMFTGSVATGRRVAEACAKKLIPSVLELGGKDAMIVLADADLETCLQRGRLGQLHELRASVFVGRATLRRRIRQRILRGALRREKQRSFASGRAAILPRTLVR